MSDPSSKDIILARHISLKADCLPDKTIVTFVDIAADGAFSEQPCTYKMLWENGQRMGKALLDVGMKQNDAFGIVMQNHPEFLYSMIGSSVAGTIFVPIDPRTRGEKLVHMLGFSECRGAIIADYALSTLLDVLDRLPKLEWVWVLGEADLADLPQAQNVSSLLDTPVPNVSIRADDPNTAMQMLFTSGTTGDPKGILSPYERLRVSKLIPDVLGLNAQDCLYTGLSLTHANAQILTLCVSLYSDIPCVISKKFTKSRLWDITREYNCTVFNLLGGMTTGLYSEPEYSFDTDNPVRMVLSAGMPKAIWQNFSDRFGVDIFEMYGAAEGGLTFNPPGIGPIGSIGKPPPHLEMKIVDKNDHEVSAGQQGEIIFRNADGTVPVVKYFKNGEASAKKTKGGWLRMGDIGTVDEDGWAYFLFRDGSGIRRNGDFVTPAYVEKEIAEQNSVDDVYVYGVPTPENAPGEKEIVAAIVPKRDEIFDPATVFSTCREKLENNFVPRFIQLVSEIPKTASEKPIERLLHEAFENGTDVIFDHENPSPMNDEFKKGSF